MRIHAPNRFASLVGFGLSETSARVYLALVDQASMTATALSSAANVPRSHLYNVIQELQSLGLVDIVAEESRRTFRAKPFSNYLLRRERELQEQISALQEAGGTLAQALQPPPLGLMGDEEAGEVRLVIGRRAVANELDAMLARAETSIVASASDNAAPRLARHLARWKADHAGAADRVRPLVFLPCAPAGWAQPDFPSDGIDVRRLKRGRPVISLVIDGEALLIIHPIPDTPDERTGRDFAVFTNDRAFARGHVALLEDAAET
ncbi:MAG TPA: helix-turn-helix domain-containing protein [Candidatus Thermoplasmatota archaeon]|nr:helix-turn-helix domain-containing protein [Candidatus Thermoplasmatota archaeon]